MSPEHLQSEKNSRIVCALLYLAGRAKITKLLCLIRLLYLADKYHFIHHGSTVSGDHYAALGIGPAGVGAMIVSNAWTLCVGMFDVAVVSTMFSLTEKVAMDHAVEQFAGMSDEDLEAYMLTLPEWTVARKLSDMKASLTGAHSGSGPDGQPFFPIEVQDLLLTNGIDPHFDLPQEFEEELYGLKEARYEMP